MSAAKQIILIILIVIVFLAQSSHPALISINSVVPNSLFCVFVVLLTVYDYKNIWPMALFTILLLEINTSTTTGVLTISAAIIGLVVVRLKQILTDKIFAYSIIPLVTSVLYELLMQIIIIFWLGFDWGTILPALYTISIYELAMHYLITLFFIGLLEIFFVKKKNTIKFQLEN